MIVRPARSPAAIVATVCTAEILGMTTFSMFLALQPQLQREWGLSNTASGWVSSAFYTTSFTLGSSGSYFLVGQLAEHMAWRSAVATLAIGPAAGWLLVGLLLERATPYPGNAAPVHGARWGEVIHSPDSMRYVVAYACHTWELFGMRAWLVPFLVFCAARQGPTFAAPTTIAAMLSVAGIPASFAGAELSARFDRRSVIGASMLTSAATGIAVGLLTSQAWPLILAVSLLHHALVMGDSAALTSGLVASSPTQSRGTAMALYSMAGFAAAAAASFAIGGVLDLFGGQSETSWAVAFIVMVSSNALGAAALWRTRR